MQPSHPARAQLGRLTPSPGARGRLFGSCVHRPPLHIAAPCSQGPDHKLRRLRAVCPGQSDAQLLLQKSQEGDAEGLETLLWAQVPANIQADNGQTPLMLAVMASNAACVGLLLAAGADVNAVDESGTTALHLAAVTGDLPILHRLCAAGDIDLHARLKTTDAFTPAQLAEFAGNLAALAYLEPSRAP